MRKAKRSSLIPSLENRRKVASRESLKQRESLHSSLSLISALKGPKHGCTGTCHQRGSCAVRLSTSLGRWKDGYVPLDQL